MQERIGYFIPEFPGQTHAFFWRERRALQDLDIQAEWLSTRRPPKKIISHSWAKEAEQDTTYLLPFTTADSFQAFTEILSAGPVAWWRCFQSIVSAPNLSIKDRAKLFAMIGVAGKLSRISKQANWHHIHVHSCANSANIAMFNYFLTGVTYSLTLHGPALETYGNNQEEKWKYSLFSLVVSDKLLKDVQVKLKGYLPPMVVSVPMGVNLSELERKSPYQAWEEGQPCHIFSCGRLNLIKGHDYLLQTLAMLKARGIPATLTIAGEDEQGGQGYHQTLVTLIDELGLQDSVNLLGAVSQERIRQELESAHVFALASHNEGIPVAVMEAMAMEMPVVVTDVGGNSELIESGRDGILVPDREPEAMANAISEVLKSQEIARSLSQASRQKIAEKFHDRRSAEILYECLQKALTAPEVSNPTAAFS